MSFAVKRLDVPPEARAPSRGMGPHGSRSLPLAHRSDPTRRLVSLMAGDGRVTRKRKKGQATFQEEKGDRLLFNLL